MPPVANGLDRYDLVGKSVTGQGITHTLDAPFAAGGFGVVYKARYQQGPVERPSAVKVFAPAPGAALPKVTEEAFRAQFLVEARKLVEIAAWLGDDRAGMAEVLGYGEITVGGVFGLGGRKVPWIAYRFVAGKTLRAWLTEPVSPRQCLALLTPVLDVLGRLHRYTSADSKVVGAAHVDNKPENLLVERSGGVERAVLIDFGTVKLLSPAATPYTNTTTPKGLRVFTPGYGTAEQFMGLHTGPWTDVAQMGLILTEMLCGREGYAEPVEGADDAQAQQHYMFQAAVERARPTPGRWGVPVGAWEPVVARSVAIDPTQRQPHAGVLLDELRETVDEAESAWQAWRRSLVAKPFRTPSPPAPPPVSQPPRPMPPPAPPPVVKPRVLGPDGLPLPVGVRPTDDPRYYRCNDGLGDSLLMAYVRAGTFIRGSEEYGNEEPVQRVKLPKGFYVGVYPVTVDEYARFVAKGKDGAKHAVEKAWFAQTGTHPVVKVSWHDATAYCAATGFRLLTEAEWEYVARGAFDDPENAKYPRGRRFPWGDAEPDDTRLWWRGGSLKPGGTGPVGSCRDGRSPFGVHDLAGNVWEWVADVYRSYPNQPELEDPTALPTPSPPAKAMESTELRVLRGGCWLSIAPFDVRAALRHGDAPTNRINRVGFRVARGVM